MIPLGENHFRASARAFVARYHLERNHQGLDNELIRPAQDRRGIEGSPRHIFFPASVGVGSALVWNTLITESLRSRFQARQRALIMMGCSIRFWPTTRVLVENLLGNLLDVCVSSTAKAATDVRRLLSKILDSANSYMVH